jgi:hypothetical protein
LFPDGVHIPAIAIPGTSLRKCGVVRAKLQGAVIAVLEESLAVNAQKLLSFLD